MEQTQAPLISRGNRLGLNGLVTLVTVFTAGMVALGVADIWQTFQGKVYVDVPLREFQAHTTNHGGVEMVADESVVMFPHATTTMQWLDAASSFTVIALLLLLIGTVWALRRALLAGRPFLRSTTFLLMALSIGLLVQGLVGSVLDSILQMKAIDQLTAMNFPGYGDTTIGGFEITINLIPFGVAIFLGILAGVFEIGERMQRETEGLV